MFNKKRVLGVILSGLMVATVFAGCQPTSGDQDPTEAPTGSSDPTTPAITSYTVDEVMADAAIAMGDEDNVTLKVWAPQAAQEVFQAQIDAFIKNFEDQGKTITIELAAMGEGDAATNLTTDPEAAADVLGFASDQGLALYKDQYLLPVRLNFVEPIKETHLAGAVDTATFQANGDPEALLYAYPETGDNGYAIFYDKRVLAEEDLVSMEAIMAACEEAEKFLAIDMGNGFYGCMIPFTGGGSLAVEGENYDTQVLNYDYDKIGPVAEAFSTLLGDSEYFKAEDANSTLVSGFASGTHAAGVVGSWKINDIKTVLGDNMGVTKIPTINVDGVDTQIVTIYGYKNIGVNAATEFPLTAQSLAYYLSGEECQEERLTELSWGPSITSLVESDAVQNNEALKAIYDVQENSQPQKDILSYWWSPTGAFTGFCVNKDEERTPETLKESYDAMVESIALG